MKYNYTIIRPVLILFLCHTFQYATAQQQKTWQWAVQLGSKLWDMSAGVTCNSKDNLYIAGSFYNTLQCGDKKIKTSGNQDLFIAKFDKNGKLKDIWSGGGKGNDRATCIAATQGDNIVIGGMVTDTISLSKLKDNGQGLRLFVTNLDAKGKFTWLKTFNLTGEASLCLINTDATGTIYAAGTFSGTLSIDGLQAQSKGKKDVFMAKISPDGIIEKLFSFGGEEDDIPGALSVSDSGSITCAVVFGKPFKTGDFAISGSQPKAKTNALIINFNGQFVPQWINIISGAEYCQVASLKHDKHGNLYAAGSFNLNLWLQDTMFTAKGHTDAFLLKYTPGGKLLWGRSIGSWYYDYAYHVIPDNLGGAIVTGVMGDTIRIDSLAVTPKSGGNAALVMQFTSTGKAAWADCISGKGRNFSSGAVLDKEGNLYMTGSFSNSFEKENDELVSFGDQDIFLAKYYNCPSNQAEILGDTVFCPGTETFLSVKNGYQQVTWNNAINDVNSIVVNKPGRYWVSLYDKQGCLLTDTVRVIPADVKRFSLGSDTTLWIGDSLLLKAPANFNGYHWQNNSTDPVFLAKPQNDRPGIYRYWLSARDISGCISADTISVTFNPQPGWIEETNVKLVAYPNPVTRNLFWYLDTGTPCKMIIELTSESGRVLSREYIERYMPGQVKQMDMKDFPVGPYYIRIKGGPDNNPFNAIRIIKQ